MKRLDVKSNKSPTKSSPRKASIGSKSELSLKSASPGRKSKPTQPPKLLPEKRIKTSTRQARCRKEEKHECVAVGCEDEVGADEAPRLHPATPDNDESKA